MFMRMLPPDPTAEEIMIASSLAISLYQRIKDPTDKFIIAMVYDMGYSREDAARALGISYVTVYKRLKIVKDSLKKEYKSKIKE